MLTLRPRVRACVLVALSAAFAGCGDIDAEQQPFVGTHLYQEPMGAFELRLLVPPWIPPVVYAGQTFSVVTPMNATITADPTVLLSEALYSLQVSPMTGDPAAAMQAIQVTLPGTGATTPGVAVLTASGATGVEMAWQESPAVFHRDAFVARPGTATYRLHFTAKKDIADEAMVAQMIASFTPKK
jgi:hypothetical protein